MELSDIYRPVQEDLTAVQAELKSICQVGNPYLAELLEYSLIGGGKKIRPILALLSAKSYNYNIDTLMPIAMAVELLHLATLMHDDTIDNSAVRWGRPTVNKLWGTEQAVLLGDYLFAQTGELVARTDNLRVIKLLPLTLMIITSGEIAQSQSAFELKQARKNYLHRIASKTAALFVMATESGAILSEAPEEGVEIMREYGHNLGIAFQIVDDILDFIGTEEEMGKPVGSDLSQGTLTLPAMLLLEHYPGKDNPVKQLFHAKDGEKYISQAIEQVRNSPIIEECFEVATDYRNRACRRLEQLPNTEARQSLCELADFIINRRR
ncbi:MAG: polyprenyl synthetase family protein [Dehalococcoidales bacterium]|nr:MAG: polyprenyl synthetase family protein [Dehalococcoidales bacterium]